MNRSRRPSPRSVAAGRATEAAVLRPDPVAEMTDVTFFEALHGHATIVDLWAPWCEPCKALSPIVDKLARKHASERVHFMRVNVDECPNIAVGLGLMSIPSLVLFDNTGDVIDRLVGLPSLRRLKQLIAQADAAARDE